VYTCPHCHAKSISALAKLWSGSSSPARCKQCDGLSNVRTFWHIGPALWSWLLLGSGAVVAITLDAVWPSVVGLALAVSLFTYRWHREPLFPTSNAQVAAGRPFAWAAIALLLAALVAASVLQSAKAAGPSVKGTSTSGLCPLAAAPYVER